MRSGVQDEDAQGACTGPRYPLLPYAPTSAPEASVERAASLNSLATVLLPSPVILCPSVVSTRLSGNSYLCILGLASSKLVPHALGAGLLCAPSSAGLLG